MLNINATLFVCKLNLAGLLYEVTDSETNQNLDWENLSNHRNTKGEGKGKEEPETRYQTKLTTFGFSNPNLDCKLEKKKNIRKC